MSQGVFAFHKPNYCPQCGGMLTWLAHTDPFCPLHLGEFQGFALELLAAWWVGEAKTRLGD